MKNLMKSLAEFQQECPTILKKESADVTTKSGGKYSYKYADLPYIMEIINPLLFKHGFVLTQPLITNDSGGRFIKTILFHLESGEELVSTMEIPQVSFVGMNDYQALGSGITYIRRYSLSIVGIVTDEDTDAAGDQVKAKDAKPELPLMSKKQCEDACARISDAKPNITITEDGNILELTLDEFFDKLKATFRIRREFKEALKHDIEFQETLNKAPDKPTVEDPTLI